MSGDLYGEVEKIVGSQLLSGPLVDQYLREIGVAMLEKLKSDLTCLVPPVVLFMSIQIYNYFSSLCVGYGDIKKLPKKLLYF